MNKRSLVLAAALVAAFGAQAQSVKPQWTDSSWRVHDVPSTRSAAEVRAELDQFKKGANPWSIAYNPLAGFASAKSSAQLQAEYVASRDAVTAMNGEDSGSAFLAARQPANAATRLAGQPASAQ